ncbi:MAG: DUF1624 domain-containing protein [Acidobacteria bacterium]|nr:DUF1624 domain-containing protein [Acidobacteriota bacterium]
MPEPVEAGGAPVPPTRTRAGYIDWMRGLAVLVMILAHVIDAWTVTGPARQTRGYFWFMVIAGMGAPMFLWLAGLAVPLAAHARMRRGASVADASRALQRRGWEIFGLALLFRLQAYVFSSGASLAGLLKVDILNVMGLSLVAAGWCWGRCRTSAGRIALASAVMVAVVVLSAPLRVWQWPGLLPDAIEWYLRPAPARTTFTLFPWSAFVFAGLALGEALATLGRDAHAQWRFHAACAFGGLALAGVAYRLSYLPTLVPGSAFWTTSPAFFAIRTGALIATLGILYFALKPGGLWDRVTMPRAWSPMELFGRTSLFVYWVHVELAYGMPSKPLHKALSFEGALVACALFTVFMLLLAMAKTKLWDRQTPWRT